MFLQVLYGRNYLVFQLPSKIRIQFSNFSPGVVYLMHKGEIISNHSFFQLWELEGLHNGLHCTTGNGGFTMKSPQGKWYQPNGKNVACDSQSGSSDPLYCGLSSDARSVILYSKPHSKLDIVSSIWIGTYSCCLPDLCDSVNSSRVTARIYGEFIKPMFTLMKM